MVVKINSVKIRDRIRSDLGALDNLKKSLRKHGLLHPILIDSKGELIAGYRRIMAAKELGWEEIEVKTIDPKNEIEFLEMEMEENIVRKEFTPKELLEGLKRKKQLASPNIFIRFLNYIKKIFKRK